MPIPPTSRRNRNKLLRKFINRRNRFKMAVCIENFKRKSRLGGVELTDSECIRLLAKTAKR